MIDTCNAVEHVQISDVEEIEKYDCDSEHKRRNSKGIGNPQNM
jgi:hypothetical protein